MGPDGADCCFCTPVSRPDTRRRGTCPRANTIVSVSRQGTQALAALLAALLSVAALAACGGSDSSPGSSSTEGNTETSSRTDEGTGENGGKSSGQDAGDDGTGSGASVPTSPLEVSGGGSGQYRVKGGDNSIQDFGEESSESELEEAATALHDYYVALARSEWQRACSKLSDVVVGQLRALASQAKQGIGKGCAAILGGISPSLPASVARESTIVDAGSLRVEGDRGFLIYRGAEGTVYAINMALEDDSWKVGALAGVPLS